MVYLFRKLFYRRVGYSWHDSPDPNLSVLQAQLRRLPGVLDALPARPSSESGVFMISLVVDSSAQQSRIEDAGAQGVRWMRENVGDSPCAILVHDESQVAQVAGGQYLPGTGEISWWFRAEDD